MIKKLTKKQEAGIKEWQEHCLAIGRDTSPIDKQTTERCWKEFYKILKFNEPTFWYCQSPLQAQIIINILKKGFLKNIIKDLGDNIRANIRANIGANIWANIEANIWANIKANIWANIKANIWDNIRDNIRDNIGANIWANIEANIWANIKANIWDNIRDNIWANIEANIRANIEANIWDNIRDNIWANIEANIWANIEANIRANIGDLEHQDTWSWCQHDISWIAYYKYYSKYDLLKIDDNFKIIDIWYDLAKSCGWCYTYENIVFVCEKPSKLHLNENGRLHCESEMALQYSDGYGLWMLNGVRVPEYLITTKAEDLDIEFFKKEKNADVKAEFIKKFGKERMLEFGKKIDDHTNYSDPMWTMSEYALYDMSVLYSSINFAPHLYMKNQSVEGIFHLEAVHPDCKTLDQALDWRYDGNHKNIIAIK